MRTVLRVAFFSALFCINVAEENVLGNVSFMNMNLYNVSSRCRDQVIKLAQAFASRSSKAANDTVSKMLDANSRVLPSGIKYGNLFDLGNYDECISIEMAIDGAPKIYGQYCLSTFADNNTNNGLFPNINGFEIERNDRKSKHPGLPDGHLRMLGIDPTTIGLHLAFCVPNECTAQDLNKAFPSTKPIFDSKFCRTKNSIGEISTKAYVGMSFFSILIAIAVLSTAYDIYLQQSETKALSELFVAFSVYTNGRKIFRSSYSSDQLSCINGLKAISMMWVVIAHQYSIQSYINNALDVKDWLQDKSSMFIIGATVSVDTFFAVGGVLIVYTFLRSCDKGFQITPLNILLFYIHRYIRLTPALAGVIIFYVTLLMYMGDGPQWSVIQSFFIDGCNKDWWKTLLYVQNYALKDNMCVPQTWYLAVDMQLFLLSPLILIPLHLYPRYTVWGIVVLCIAGIVSPFCISWHDDIGAMMTNMNSKTMKHYYMATHARFGPYVIGMLAGYIIYKMKKANYNLKIPKVYVLIFWILLLAGLVGCVFGGYDLVTNQHKMPNSLYNAFCRQAWGLGISLLIIACTFGYGGPINAFLSLPIFQIIAKLSYAMYLVHYALIHVKMYSLRTVYQFSNSEVMFQFWGFFMETMAFSLLLCLLLESPMIIIEKLLFGTKTKRKSIKSPVPPPTGVTSVTVINVNADEAK